MPKKAMSFWMGIFGHLTLLTLLTPSSHVRGHARPVASGPKKGQRSLHPLVTMLLMDLGQNLTHQHTGQQ